MGLGVHFSCCGILSFRMFLPWDFFQASVWSRQVTRPRIRLNILYSEDGTNWDKKNRTTEADMDVLCQRRHDICRDNTM